MISLDSLSVYFSYVTMRNAIEIDGRWEELYKGRDSVLQAARIKTPTGHLERAVHQPYPLKLSCDTSSSSNSDKLNPDATVFQPTRAAAAVTRIRIQGQASNDDE